MKCNNYLLAKPEGPTLILPKHATGHDCDHFSATPHSHNLFVHDPVEPCSTILFVSFKTVVHVVALSMDCETKS